MPPPTYDREYDRIRGGDGRRYSVWKAKGPTKLAQHGHGAMFPEDYAPLPGRPNAKWHCPIIGCDSAFRLLRDLGEHFTTEHRGAKLHDLRNGQFRVINDEGNGLPCVVYRSNNPPSPIHPPFPPSSPASSAVRSSSVERGTTPGLYVKREFSVIPGDGEEPRQIVIDAEDDQHTSSTQDGGNEEEEGDSDDDIDDVFSIGNGQDRESNTSVSDEEDAAAAPANNVHVQTPDRNGYNDNLENGQYFNYAASAVWRHINSFTRSRLPVPDDTCLRELLTLPLARELPRSWRVRLGKQCFTTERFNLKMMTAMAIFLTGEETDEKACTAFGCLTRNPVKTAQALTDFAANSDVCHGMFAFPRCVFPSAHDLMSSVTLKERLDGITCCNAYYFQGKKPEAKLIYVAGYPLPYPITPENPPRAAPAPNRRDNGATPTPGQPQSSPPKPRTRSPQSSPLKSRSTSESLKRKTSPCAASDDYAYRLSTDPATPAKWESLTGLLHQRESFSEPVIAYSPSYVRFHTSTSQSNDHGRSDTRSHTDTDIQANKRIKLLSSPSSSGSSSSTLADFRVIHLQHPHSPSNADDPKSKGAQTVSLPISKTRAFVCSVASGGPVRVYLDKGKGEGQEKPFDIMEGGVWIVERGWECRMEVAIGGVDDDVMEGIEEMEEGMQVTVSVHVTGVLALAGENEKRVEKESGKEKAKEEAKEKKKEIKEQEKKAKEERNKEKEAKKQAKKEKRKEKEIKREKKKVKKEKKEKEKQEKEKKGC
ncbi:hypothetical protein N0V85_003014 [Neurospora sp. IMI 360204]|nr:hypothetical protein N0V85_003014 [Neurospora sp. IMI 360204]